MNSESESNCVILQDINRANPCEFPKGISDPAVIENPCNKDEILIFGGYRSNDIYIYNKKTHTIKQNDASINIKKLGLESIKYISVVSGNRKNSVIVLWNDPSCYGVFDCDKMDFDGDIIKCSGSTEAVPGSGTTEESGVFVPTGSSIQRWNNLLFIFGERSIAVYDINDEYVPKQIKYFRLSKMFNKSYLYSGSRTYHRSFIIESNINIKNKNKVHLKFLLFGAFCEHNFNKSFYQIDIDIEKIDSSTGTSTSGGINCNNDNINYKFNISCDDKAKDWKMPAQIADKYNYDSKLTYVSAHWYNSRYLIISGGYSKKIGLDEIICFDYKKKKWHIGDEDSRIPMYKMPMGLLGHTTLLKQENGHLYLYVFGGCIDTNYYKNNTKTCWKLRLTTQIDWKIERIIWIAYKKNDKNTSVCQFARLPKDVVILLLSFLQPRFIFE